MSLGTYTSTVDQSYFIEAIKGSGHPTTYLDKYSDAVYNTSPDSILYKLIYTLIGPAGVASLKHGYFEARLKLEEMGLQYSELEKFYANPMGFGRLAVETYSEETVGLLNNDIWSKIKSQDQAYKNRVIDFMHAVRLGGTPDGIKYAAKSALGQDVEIIEGYQYLFDQNSDLMLDLEGVIPPSDLGVYSTEAFGIKPNPEISKTVIQTITFDPIPNSGSFTISCEGEKTGSISVDGSETTYSILSAQSFGYTYVFYLLGGHLIPKGATVSIEGSNIQAYNNTFVVTSTTYDSFTVTGAVSNPGTPSFSSGRVNVRLDLELKEDIRSKLSALQSIKSNVKVVGNLETGFKIQFIGKLSNQLDGPVLKIDSSSLQRRTGSNVAVRCFATIVSSSGVVSPNEEVSGLSPEIHHALRVAIDQIKPVASYPIVFNGQSYWNQARLDISVNPTRSSSEYNKVVRFVTGKSDVEWPEPDKLKKTSYWIVKNKEIEAPAADSDLRESYQNFHKINNIYAYDASNSSVTNQNYSIGNFTNNFVKAFPILNQTGFANVHFKPEESIASHTKPRTGTSLDTKNDETLIDGIYPIKYFNLKNVLIKPINNLFWASRPKLSGDYDYLEIDFGETRAVNFIAFEVLKTPLTISIEYDDYDYGNIKNWVPANPIKTPDNSTNYAFDSNIIYSVSNLVPWQYCTYLFSDISNNLIYTRYVRIKFDRKINESLYPAEFLKESWPVCVKNLRIGRNI